VKATENKPNFESLKILAVGNSFSEDATEYIPIIARDCGIKNIVIGNAYIGGCSLAKHAANAKGDAAAYKYYKNTTYSTMSAGPATYNVTLDKILRDEDWDYITLQQASGYSGMVSSYNEDLDYMIDYVKDRCPNAKLGWHMTWAYQSNYTSSSFTNNYGKNQARMYSLIVSSVKSKIVTNDSFDFIIPVGTAIQNARTGFLGDTLTRDGLHLDLKVGRFIAAVTWMKILGYDTNGLKFLSKYDAFVNEVADNALEKPFGITKTAYTTEKNGKPFAEITETEEKQTEKTPETAKKEDTSEKIVAPVDSSSSKTKKGYAVAGALAFALAALATTFSVKKRKKH